MSNVPESMFPPGSTPYGPPAGAPPVAAPSQPYVASPAAWVSAPVAPRPLKNGFGVAAVWLGAFGLLVAFSGISTSWIFLLAAGVLGFIAVARVGRPRTAAIVGLSVAGLGLLIAIVVTVSRF